MLNAQPRVLMVATDAPPSRSDLAEFARGLVEAYDGELELIAPQGDEPADDAFGERALAQAAGRAGWVQVIHLCDASLGHLATRFADATGAPVVVSVQGDDLPRENAARIEALRGALADRRVTAVASCPTVAAEVSRLTGVTPQVVDPGVEEQFWAKITEDRSQVNEFRSVHLDLPVGVRLILSIGDLLPRRGTAWFAREVLPRLPSDVRYVVAGDGADEDALRALDDPRVILSPIRLKNETAALFYCVDLVVFPNLPSPTAPEGYRLQAAQANAASRPILLADMEGCADTAAHVGLRVVPAGDAEAWATAVIEALNDPPRGTRVMTPWAITGLDYLRLYRAIANLPA
jgi:phosphatidyl-myo-inositol dimannoside synthase